MLTDGRHGAWSLGVDATGDRVLRLVRRHRRRCTMARMLGLDPERAAPAPQASYGRRRLAVTLARLPYRSQAAVLLVDGCGMSVPDVAAGLGRSERRVHRSLDQARTELARSVALADDDVATLAAALGAVLRSLSPPSPAVDAVASTVPRRGRALVRSGSQSKPNAGGRITTTTAAHTANTGR